MATFSAVAAKPARTCPVCGQGYRGNLVDHLDRKLKGSGGLTRCDWNLNSWRVAYAVRRMELGGWVKAGSAPARVVALLKDTHPHLARLTVSGGISARAHSRYLLPENDMKVWWTRPWCQIVAAVPGWNTMQRAQVIMELDGHDDATAVVEAAFRVGGCHAVAALEGSVVAPRCREQCVVVLPMPDRMGSTERADWCVRAAGHSGCHQGARTSRMWGVFDPLAE